MENVYTREEQIRFLLKLTELIQAKKVRDVNEFLDQNIDMISQIHRSSDLSNAYLQLITSSLSICNALCNIGG